MDGRIVMEKVGILAGGWKDGCGAGGNIGWWMEGWLWSKWKYWLMDGRMVVEQMGILAGGWKDDCGASGNIGWWMEG